MTLFIYFFLSLPTPAVVVDNKILLSGSFQRVHYSLSLPVSACLSVCTFCSLWSAHYTCTVLLHTQHARKSKQSRYNMKRSIVDYFKKKNAPEEMNEAVVGGGGEGLAEEATRISDSSSEDDSDRLAKKVLHNSKFSH